MKNRALILANGSPLVTKPWKRFKKCTFIALDGAANALARSATWPDFVIGDFDSILPQTKRQLTKRGVPLVYTPDQNFTDLEKALQWCEQQKIDEVWLFQALGKRLDHSLQNLLQLKAFAHLHIRMFSDQETIRVVHNSTLQIVGKKLRRIALFPLPAATVSSRGLEWEMKKVRLQLGQSASVANRALGQKVSLKVQGTALLIEEGWNFL
jgi:thiamine pyrophosphokinase